MADDYGNADAIATLVACTPALGQATMAASSPVTIASDQTVDVNLKTALSSATDSVTSVSAGNVAHDAVDAGNPVKIGGYGGDTAKAAVQNGDRVDALFNAIGQLQISSGSYDGTAGADGRNVAGLGTRSSTMAAGSVVPLGVASFAFNGATWDRRRGNADAVLLASAARTATTSTADLVNFNGRSAKCVLNVTVEGAATLALSLQGKDSISGNYYDIVNFGTVYIAASDTPPVTRAFFVGPGVLTADLIGIAGATGATSKAGFVPRTYRWTITHADATATTYSLSGGEHA